MHNKAAIQQLLHAAEIPIQGEIVDSRDAQDKRMFVFVPIRRTQDNRQYPSNRSLADVKAKLAGLGIDIEFLLVYDASDDVEGGLRATLLYAFGAELRNVFLSSLHGVAQVWLDSKRTLEQGQLDAIRERARAYLESVGLELGSLSVPGDESLPGKLATLRIIRRHAPIALSDLKAELQNRGFVVPSVDWLRRRLDSWRKAGSLVVAGQDEAGPRFALSLQGIRSLGTSRGRTSPDLARLLALARAQR